MMSDSFSRDVVNQLRDVGVADPRDTEIARLTRERDDWAYKYNESCDTYSAMHVALGEAEDERDRAKALLQSCIKGNNTMKDKTQKALARAAAAAMEMRERAASLTERYMIDAGVGSASYIEICREVAGSIRNLPIDPDAQKALDKLLAKAREDAIREAAELVEDHFPGTVYASSRTKCLRAILALLNDGGRDE